MVYPSGKARYNGGKGISCPPLTRVEISAREQWTTHNGINYVGFRKNWAVVFTSEGESQCGISKICEDQLNYVNAVVQKERYGLIS